MKGSYTISRDLIEEIKMSLDEVREVYRELYRIRLTEELNDFLNTITELRTLKKLYEKLGISTDTIDKRLSEMCENFESLREQYLESIKNPAPSAKLTKDCLDHILKSSRGDRCRITQEDYSFLKEMLEHFIQSLSNDITYLSLEKESPVEALEYLVSSTKNIDEELYRELKETLDIVKDVEQKIWPIIDSIKEEKSKKDVYWIVYQMQNTLQKLQEVYKKWIDVEKETLE